MGRRDEFTADTVVDAEPLIEAEAAAPVAEISDQITARNDLRKSAEFRAGLEIGQAAGRSAGEADAITELRKVREDCVETFRSFYVIWNITTPPTWEEAEAWFRSRLTPF